VIRVDTLQECFEKSEANPVSSKNARDAKEHNLTFIKRRFSQGLSVEQDTVASKVIHRNC
jgi:hypothetical protein